jgi:hypothetical protein
MLDSLPLNWTILRNPFSWLVIGSMVLIWSFAFQQLSRLTPKDDAE